MINPRSYILHSGLLMLTFVTATFAGVQWLNQDPFVLENFSLGIPYALLLLLVLGSHELGHYIAAQRKGIKATLPYFIPLPLLPGMLHFGTLGAVIKLQEPVRSRKEIFDIGAAGPLAGFVVCTIVLAVGFATLPPIDYLYSIHPEYRLLQTIPTGGVTFGHMAFFSIMSHLVSPPGAFVPPMNEIYHYPFLCVGWFGLFVTAMNLIPVGQLDGGHICFALFGAASRPISVAAVIGLILLGLGGIPELFGSSFSWGWIGWLFWAAILTVFTKGVRKREPLPIDEPLDVLRRVIGWTTMLVFLLCFAPMPFTLGM